MSVVKGPFGARREPHITYYGLKRKGVFWVPVELATRVIRLEFSVNNDE